MANNTRRRPAERLMEGHTALLTFGLCGLVGVSVDVDHLISILLWRYFFPGITEGRIWHTPLFIISCLVICCICARPRGLHYKLVLMGALVITITVLVLVLSPLTVWRW